MSEGRARSARKGDAREVCGACPPRLGPCAARLNTVIHVAFREESFDSLHIIANAALPPPHTPHVRFNQFMSDLTTGGCEQRTECVEGLCDL